MGCVHGPLTLLITAGQRGGSPLFEAVLESIRVPELGLGRPRKRPDRVRADKAYDSRSNRFYLRRRGTKATIPLPVDRVRNRVERDSRGGGPPKFDELAVRYEATVLVAVINQHRCTGLRRHRIRSPRGPAWRWHRTRCPAHP
ncbi:transposase [Streptomyces violaceorubidus]|uniref:Transposase n=1 Tax=Streptomyces violaceorubidus TaxID=284042 RepID=A0ABV1SUU9_9ACTN